VASAGDGSVRFYQAGDLQPLKAIALGKDADNIRIDPATGHVLVGYGKGGLGIIDARTETVVGDIRLLGHPESFQIETQSNRAFVNVPEARQVAVVDLKTDAQVAAWDTSPLQSNFPMALGDVSNPLAVVFRAPAALAVLDPAHGGIAEKTPTCGDADDVFFDAKRSRFYVICGEGVIDVVDYAPGRLAQGGRKSTSRGARTGVYAAQLDRLYVAAPAGGPGSRAAILVFRLSP
jgi:hypothetical protein